MPRSKVCALFLITAAAIGLPFVVLHLMANPDDAPISPIQHAVAALANFFGPWGVAIVRLVDFPNAGMRSFSWPIAGALTLTGALLVYGGMQARHRAIQWVVTAAWGGFLLAWFGVGFVQIAGGLL